MPQVGLYGVGTSMVRVCDQHRDTLRVRAGGVESEQRAHDRPERVSERVVRMGVILLRLHRSDARHAAQHQHAGVAAADRREA